MKLQSKPRLFQKEDAKALQYKCGGRGLLSSEPGLGKSLTSLLWWYWFGDKTKPVIIVCPSTLKENWKRECRKHFKLASIILESRSPCRLLTGKWVYIINYDILAAWQKEIIKIKPGLIILDECAYIKSPKTKRTKSAKRICKAIKSIIAISGTPLISRPAELWPVLNILKPKRFPVFWPFGHEFCAPRKSPWGWEFKGATNLDKLNRILKKKIMVRRLKKDVLSQLPPKTRTVIPLTLNKKEKKEYHTALTNFILWLKRKSKRKASKAKSAERLVQLGYLRRLAATLKLPQVISWVQDFLEESNGKLILFCTHKAVISQLKEHFGSLAVVVDGSITGKKRQRAIDRFNIDKNCRLFIGNIQAAGVGWSCMSSSTIAFCELPWTPGEITQAEDRIHGIGRGQKGVRANIYFLIAKETIEQYLCSLLQSKREILDQTLDGSIDASGLSIMDQLEQLLTQEKK